MFDVIRHEDMPCVCGHTRRAHRAAGCCGAKTVTRNADHDRSEERCGCEEFQPAVVHKQWDWTRMDEADRR